MTIKRLDEEFQFNSKTPVHNTLTRLLTAIEVRLQGLEELRVTQEEVISDLVEVGLARMDQTFTPLINAAVERLNTLGVQFTAMSASSVSIGTGQKTLVIPEGQRDAFIYGSHINVSADSSNFMVATVTSYDRPNGVLVFNSILAEGSGTHAAWTISLTGPPDVTHATRTDNPHNVTAEQTGAYSSATIDFIYTTLINTLLHRVNNLQDVANVPAARANLGLGTAATKDVGASPAQVPQNSNLGTAAYVNAGHAGGNALLLGGDARVPLTDTGISFPPGGRLTVDPGNAVQKNMNPGQATAIYYSPHLHKYVPIFNGSHVINYPIVSPGDHIGLTFDMGGSSFWPADKVFDIFVAYIQGVDGAWLGTANVPWQTNTARGVGPGTTELEWWHGMLVNKHQLTFASAHGVDAISPRQAHWLGCVYTTANGMYRMDLEPPAAAGGNQPKLCLWNNYNRVPLTARLLDSTAGVYTLTPAMGLRAFNNSNNNRFTFLCGEGRASNCRVASSMLVGLGTSVGYYNQWLQDALAAGSATAQSGLRGIVSGAAGGFTASISVELNRKMNGGLRFLQLMELAQTNNASVGATNMDSFLTMEM